MSRSPPRPPSPPVTLVFTALAAEPVLPDAESDCDSAPELARLWAAPAARASPVAPVLPESPLLTVAATLELPLILAFDAVRSAVAFPVLPESPDPPLAATGLALAVELAGPVLPVLVAVDCAHAVPESPDCASGSSLIHGEPPSPPLASPLAIESPPAILPPLTRLLRPLMLRRTLASPARSEWTLRRSPPRPPLPPTAVTFAAFATSPVSPEVDVALEPAPLLAIESAVLAALALPVLPVRPESPDRTVEALMLALPLILVFMVAAVSLASPVLPEAPESPDMATGSAVAVEEAAPVLPVLVADDWARDSPESPETAVGLWSLWTSPPAPPLTEPLAMESPPVTEPSFTRLPRPEMVWRALASPARPECTRALSPPRAPLPPSRSAFTALAASPVLPETELASDAAPELAMLWAEPLAWALPVLPVRPESPDATVTPLMLLLPLMAVFTTPKVPLASPVLPESPELPETAVGSAIAVDEAGPVLPVLVADDSAWTSPELPDWATGAMTTLGDPPEPPFALPLPVESPPALVSSYWK